jgi:hypothetical protein
VPRWANHPPRRTKTSVFWELKRSGPSSGPNPAIRELCLEAFAHERAPSFLLHESKDSGSRVGEQQHNLDQTPSVRAGSGTAEPSSRRLTETRVWRRLVQSRGGQSVGLVLMLASVHWLASWERALAAECWDGASVVDGCSNGAYLDAILCAGCTGCI